MYIPSCAYYYCKSTKLIMQLSLSMLIMKA